MKVKVESSKPCEKILNIEVSQEEVIVELDKIFDEIAKVAEIPGFRTGKAPKDVVRLHYAALAQNRLLDRLIPAAYQWAISKEKISPVELPLIKEVNFKPNLPLTFIAHVAVRPQVKLKNYKGIKITKRKSELKDEEITKALGFLQERAAQYQAVEDRPVAWDDYIICDLAYSISGAVIDKKENTWIYIKENSYMKGFPENILGARPNETRKFSLTVPEDFPNKEQAGKPADFVVLVKEIKIKKMPQLSDDLAKDFGKETLDELKNSLKEGMIKEKEMEVKLDMERQLIDDLVKTNVFDIPQALVEKQVESLIEQRKQRLLYQGFKQEDIDKQMEFLKRQAEADAQRQVRSFFIFEKIAESEKIAVNEEQINKRIELLAASYQKTPQEMRKYFEDKDMLHELVWELTEERIKDFLVKCASISEEKIVKGEKSGQK